MNNKIVLSYIVPLYFNQKNNSTLLKVLERYSSYDKHLLAKIHFILIDDCSPIKITLPETSKLNISLLRITTDIRWNQGGARNLGGYYAKTSKLLLTDIDHIFPERTLKHLIRKSYSETEVYRFRRFDGLKKVSSGVNIFSVSKALFNKAQGYDESFCGHYGHEDTHLFDSFERTGATVKKISNLFPSFELRIDREAEYHSLVRDTKRNTELLKMKRENKIEWHSGLNLNFDWEIVEEKVAFDYK